MVRLLPLKKRWIAGLSAAALMAAAGLALAQDRAPISPPPGYAPAPPPSSLEPDDLPTQNDDAPPSDGTSDEGTGLAPAIGYDEPVPGNDEDQGGGLPRMRGSTADEQPMDIGVTPPAPPEDATSPDVNNPGGLTPDTAPGDVLTPIPGQQEQPQPAQATHQPLPRASAEPGGMVAVLRGLDKISARVTVVDAPIGKPVMFGRLRIIADYCHKHPPELAPEVTAFVRIDDTRVKDPTRARIFSGWMYASSPALHAVEHPVYDVWLTDCKTSTPESDFGSLPNNPAPKEDSVKHMR